MTVSIVIAVKTWQDNLRECINKCLRLNYSDFEILILPDFPMPEALEDEHIKVIPTGVVSPARKRDIAINFAKGEILAFIDDDAYPDKDWLKNAVNNFVNPEIAAIGGPAVTAPDDNIKEKASGLIYSSLLVSAKFVYRYLPKKRQEIDDYPSCNLLVRKSVMQEIGGFNTDFWPGEDTKLCLSITKGLGKKIIYDPEVLVYHHRRPLFLGHLRQVSCYALHRGYFVKRFPQTSLKISYFLPSLFIIALLSGAILSLFFGPLRILYFFGLFLYLSLVFAVSICRKLNLIPFLFLGIILTHIDYGFYFLKGIFSKKLKEE